MALTYSTTEVSHIVPTSSPLVLYEPRLTFDPKDVRALTGDFFRWFEHEWRQPIVRAYLPEGYDLLNQPSLKSFLDEEKLYTVIDLATIGGWKPAAVQKTVYQCNICAVGKTRRQGHTGNGYNLYLGRDLVPLVERWERLELWKIIDAIWGRFLEEPCGECSHCRRNPNKAQFYCHRDGHKRIKGYRDSFFNFLAAILRYGDIETWWMHERDVVFARKRGAINRYTGLVLIYLLDRRLLALTFDEFLRIPFHNIEDEVFLRPWQRRRPEEYKTFLLGLEKTGDKEHMRRRSLRFLGKWVLLRNGFPGIAELGRPLTLAEIQQATQEGRLLTQYLAHGISLSVPLTNDIRVGHVVLDEIRFYLWKYDVDSTQQRKKWYWSHGQQGVIQVIEEVLKAKIWFQDNRAILSSRPETEKDRFSPYVLRSLAEQHGNSVTLLPQHIQDAVQSYITYRYQHQRIELSTLTLNTKHLLPFLCWLQEQSHLSEYSLWDRDTTVHTVRLFLSEKCAHFKNHARSNMITTIQGFFQTLAEIGLPHASRYSVLQTLHSRDKNEERSMPPEEVLDRVFQDGVCKLDYDPFSRLALTIQYYCGTRVTETCDLPLFCVLEDPSTGEAYLLIPLGKTKKERMFPITSVGMGPFLEYMDQVFHMQVDPPSDETSRETPRNLPRMNVRYLETELQKAYQWDYLFDRKAYGADKGNNNKEVLRIARVCDAMKEALLLTAKQNPLGLFQEKTYSRHCQRQRRKGQLCLYFAMSDGVTSCPVCGGSLPGTRGSRCYHRVAEKLVCDGVAQEGEYFCPKCDAPLAELVKVTPHTFRHNSVTRAHRNGVSLEQNMLLHGHQTVPMHIRYLHLLPQDQQEAVASIFSEKILRHLHLEATYAPGQVIKEGVAHTATVKQAMEVTLYRGQRRRTIGVWGAFWAGALAEQGVVSPTTLRAEMIITEETYHFTVAQYRYEALGLAVSEVALERGTKRKFTAEVAPFLERKEIDKLVSSYLEQVQQGYLTTRQGVRLLEADIQAQRTFLYELAEMLQPWWEHLGSIDRLVTELFSGIDSFQKPGEVYEFDQE